MHGCASPASVHTAAAAADADADADAATAATAAVHRSRASASASTERPRRPSAADRSTVWPAALDASAVWTRRPASPDCVHALPSPTGLRASSSTVGTIAAAFLALAAAVGAVQAGRPYFLLPVVQAAVSLGGLQLAWLCFRIRARLVLALGEPAMSAFTPPSAVTASASSTASTTIRILQGYSHSLQTRMRPRGFAIHKITDKLKLTRDREVVVATLLALLASTAAVALVIVVTPLAIDLSDQELTWWLLVTVIGVGSACCVWTACLAPSGADSMLLIVLQFGFTFSRVNMVVAHYKYGHSENPEVVDDLYLTLACSCIMIAWRIISSSDVTHTLFAAMLDTLIIVFMLTTMMEIADFVDHPVARGFPFIFSAFFIVVTAGELAAWAFRTVTAGTGTSSLTRVNVVGQVAVSVVAAAIAMGVAVEVVPHKNTINAGVFIMFVGAAAVAHVGRAVLVLIKETAFVSSGLRLSVWNNGVLDVSSPFLFAWVIVHPYSKHLLASAMSK